MVAIRFDDATLCTLSAYLRCLFDYLSSEPITRALQDPYSSLNRVSTEPEKRSNG